MNGMVQEILTSLISMSDLRNFIRNSGIRLMAEFRRIIAIGV